ncbi:aldose epimerase [Pseudoroseomonas rhizosphaerae]|uniref:Aldose epimerase n=1 Tax=Teichococcus rhizosphaerae TaxID=1335062 RepID=A0A2C7AEI1_9PROT|nr:aldose 1-epimerase family protein [Pseudoroseomonas rhizosphaerae]PHK95067.1 aldose epimerase [Pseudoroseomonas rhizosphaerae]
MSDRHNIGADGLSATILAHGAELASLRDAVGEEYLWQAGPEWRRHAPVLFPIVGRLAGDTLRHAGRAHRMTQHGFARDRRFEWVERGAAACRLRLTDDAETRAAFPFGFALELAYALAGGTLTVEATIANPAESGALPCAIGAHPAFRWPLVPGTAREAHRLVFERPEPGPSHRLEGGLLGPAEPSPIQGGALRLSPALFARDALILPGVASRALRYEAPDGTALALRWEGYPDLGIWSKPEGADFLCIEPWHGMASPVGWDGEFAGKPGLLVLRPGESRSFTWSVSLGA